jgi:threonine/homoserine/homoserine lactone efflux protein
MTYFLAGFTLGFAAGVSSGPLMTLVITRTLERGLGAGLRVAIAPLLTDLPIIALSLLVFAALPPALEIALTLGGACFVLYLAWEIARQARHTHLADLAQVKGQRVSADIWQGMVVNFLSPHPWLFWISVAAPLLTRAWQNTPWAGIGFLAGFYAMLVGGKMLVAAAIAGGRRFLNDLRYGRLLLASALLLAFFAFRLFGQALEAILR